MSLYESRLNPDKSIFNEFKKICIDVLNSKTNDPFYDLNEKLKELEIEFVDFKSFINALPENERLNLIRSIIIPELGIRFLSYEPELNKIMIMVDNTFDDKFISINEKHLMFLLDQLWESFGHELIHKEQTKRMKNVQNPKFKSEKDYLKNKQEIMALAFSFIQQLKKSNYTDNEILNILKKGSFSPLYRIYKELGNKEFNLFLKYAVQYI